VTEATDRMIDALADSVEATDRMIDALADSVKAHASKALADYNASVIPDDRAELILSAMEIDVSTVELGSVRLLNLGTSDVTITYRTLVRVPVGVYYGATQ
jgi:hypothetical protein